MAYDKIEICVLLFHDKLRSCGRLSTCMETGRVVKITNVCLMMRMESVKE